MKIIILSSFSCSVKDVPFVPSIGMTLDGVFNPPPVVKSVLCYPTQETINKFKVDEKDIVAVVIID